jgi:hypothetical protein
MAGNYSEDERRVGRGINGNALLWRELQSTYYYIDTTLNTNQWRRLQRRPITPVPATTTRASADGP